MIFLICAIVISVSCLVYVNYTNNESKELIISNEKNNDKERQEQWKKMLGKGETVIGDGDNILNDSFRKK